MNAYTRRTLLQRSLLTAGGLAIGLDDAWAAPRNKVLVRLFLRGGIDGLNVVVPYGEKAYYDARPTIAIPRPGRAQGAIKLDDRFGLHPSLAPLLPLYRSRSLAFVHAVGSPAPTRSHFDAQDNMEVAAIDGRSHDGWLGRIGFGDSAFAAVATDDNVPLALRGADALAIGQLAQFGLAGQGKMRDRIESGFTDLYAGAESQVSPAGRRALESIRRVRALNPKNYRPANNAQYGKSPVGRHLRDVALLIKGDLGLRVACVDVGGWDTHTGEKNRLQRGLTQLGTALAAFHRDLGDRMADVVVLVVSEFGRTVKENGSGGTDHGHGTMMALLGGSVAGGKVYGRWPGVRVGDRYEGRDLAITTDFRTVFKETLTAHLGVAGSAAEFPGTTSPASPLGLFNR